MKKLIVMGILFFVSTSLFAKTIPLETIYTDECFDAVTFYQLVAQKTNGAIVFNVQCDGYGLSPSGTYLPTMNGTVTVNTAAPTQIRMSTVFTDQCKDAVTFYQLVAQKTNGAVVFNVQCDGYGVSPSGAYLPTLDAVVTIR